MNYWQYIIVFISYFLINFNLKYFVKFKGNLGNLEDKKLDLYIVEILRRIFIYL